MRARKGRSSRPLRRDLVAVTLAAAASAIAMNANADDIFAKFGDIKGESTHKDYKDYSDVSSWSWGVQGVPKKPGCGFDLTLAKRVDKASPELAKTMAQGKLLPTVLLKARKSGENGFEYLVLTLTNVAITSQTPSGGGGDVAFEHISLTYTTVEWKYKPQAPDGSGGGEVSSGPVEGCPP